jgi:hypothetical protein
MDDSTKLWITTLVTIALAIVGYVVKYMNDLAIVRRKDQLERVNRQLSDLYGPLYALTKVGTKTWLMFYENYAPNSDVFFSGDLEPSLEQEESFRIWITTRMLPAIDSAYSSV